MTLDKLYEMILKLNRPDLVLVAAHDEIRLVEFGTNVRKATDEDGIINFIIKETREAIKTNENTALTYQDRAQNALKRIDQLKEILDDATAGLGEVTEASK